MGYAKSSSTRWVPIALYVNSEAYYKLSELFGLMSGC